MKVDDDWVDEGLFERFQSLAEKLGTKGRFTRLYMGGQDIVLGYYAREELDRIRRATGLNIDFYKSKGQI